MAFATGPADAASNRTMQQVEATMLVTGRVDVGVDGATTGHALDDAGKLPPYVVALVARAVPALRFEPVMEDGQAVAARAKMRLRLVAVNGADGQGRVAIRSVDFGEDTPAAAPAADDEASFRTREMAPPKYPDELAAIGGKGIVYLVLKIGRDGGVEEVAVEQVNLTAVGTGGEMIRIRASLGRAATAAARRWRFAPPTVGDEAAWPYWNVRVPVEFKMRGDPEPGPGEWSAYHPGPVTRPSWIRGVEAPGFSPDLLEPGLVHLADATPKFRLLTPVGG